MPTLNYNWIAGEKYTSENTIRITNPATSETLGTVPVCNSEKISEAIDSAQISLEKWSSKTAEQRAEILNHWAENLLDNKEKIAEVLSNEQGKPFSEALGEIEGCTSFIKWFGEEGKRAYGEVIPPSHEDQRILVLRQPVGVCGLITPWNFPGAMIARKVAPLLAAGCTCVIKPSSETPMTAIAIIDELMKTNIDKGAVNLVTGNSNEISDVLMADARVRKISFTGSTKVGKMLMKKASEQVKKISLELGGNAPAIVFPDADLEAAAESIVDNKFENCGQMCNGINVIYAHESIKDTLLQKIIDKVKKLNIGIGSEDDIQIGPVVNSASIENIKRLVKDATDKGAEIHLGGEQLDHDFFEKGFFYAPTVLDNIDHSMAMTKEEIFGPVAPIISFKEERDVLESVNDSQVGLAAYFYTNDINRIFYLAERLEVGMVGVNGSQLSVPQAPFGGIKESGIGREGGHQGIEEFLEEKYISLTLNQYGGEKNV